MEELPVGYDFGDARFDLSKSEDREIVRFILSQALYGEATGVYCGKSLYAPARSRRKFDPRPNLHLQLFAEIFRILELRPDSAHWVIKLLSSHNNYYPLKVFMEHAVGEGMVLDIFKDVLLQTLPDGDPRIPLIKKKLRVVCREEIEHVAWGEKETRRLLAEHPWLKTPFYGLVELQMALLPFAARAFERRAGAHPVLKHLPSFLGFVRERVRKQGQELGFVPMDEPSLPYRAWAMAFGIALFLRSQIAEAPQLDNYLTELGFDGPAPPVPGVEWPPRRVSRVGGKVRAAVGGPSGSIEPASADGGAAVWPKVRSACPRSPGRALLAASSPSSTVLGAATSPRRPTRRCRPSVERCRPLRGNAVAAGCGTGPASADRANRSGRAAPRPRAPRPRPPRSARAGRWPSPARPRHGRGAGRRREPLREERLPSRRPVQRQPIRRAVVHQGTLTSHHAPDGGALPPELPRAGRRVRGSVPVATATSRHPVLTTDALGPGRCPRPRVNDHHRGRRGERARSPL